MSNQIYRGSVIQIVKLIEFWMEWDFEIILFLYIKRV